MDNKDGRRSRVPAGTFGASNPPPPPAKHPATPPTEAANTPAEARDSSPSEPGEGRARYKSTLVGHPTAGAAASSGPAAPVLAPPKWRGAKPYLQGEEPQPRLSSIPTPPPVAVPPGVDLDAELGTPGRTRITTKVGQPPPAQPPEAALPEEPLAQPVAAAREQEPARLAAIGDAIQQMLDGQASVPMQVEEPSADGIDEIPIDELPIEEILDGFAAPEPEPPPPAVLAAVELTRRAAPRPPATPGSGEAQAPQVIEVPRSSAAIEVDARAESPAVEASAPASKRAERGPAPAAAAPPRVRRPRVEVRLRTEGARVSSLAPAEVRAARNPDAQQAGLGILLVAAMVVIGVGGWFVTRGGYPGPPVRPSAQKVPATPAAAAAALPPVAAPPSLPPASAEPAPVVEERPADAERPAEPAVGTAKPGAKRAPHVAAKPASRALKDEHADDRASSAAREGRDEGAVLRVVPSSEHGDLPEIPARDDVRAAIAQIGAAVRECARGLRGTAQLDITVANTGFVTHAVVGGDFAGTPEGSCIARAARGAQFVPFKKPRFRVIYPFSL
jgi:hypothetical protein